MFCCIGILMTTQQLVVLSIASMILDNIAGMSFNLSEPNVTNNLYLNLFNNMKRNIS